MAVGKDVGAVPVISIEYTLSIIASLNLTAVRLQLIKDVFVRFAPVKSEPVKSTFLNVAFVRFMLGVNCTDMNETSSNVAPVKSASGKDEPLAMR